MKPILVAGQPLAQGHLPAVCIPLVATSAPALLAEATAAGARRPHLVEWRIDFFDAIADPAAVLASAQAIRAAAGVPLLLTRRSAREGGQPIALDEQQVASLYGVVCAERAADLLDVEMESSQAPRMVAAARAHGVGTVLSFHDFQQTPPLQALLGRFRQAQDLGGDVGKLAVMPRSQADVLVLLQAVLGASVTLDIAVAGMAMGPMGAVSRVCGGVFGSALTFAVGQAASAPGQIPIDELRAALAVLHRSGT
jgi:3-dehydroquinate dehydratase-1